MTRHALREALCRENQSDLREDVKALLGECDEMTDTRPGFA